MSTWKNVTEFFTEKQRHYKDMYLEIDEVYDEQLEVSLFSSEESPYEIYVSYGCMYGIIYTTAEEAEAKRQEIKAVLQKEYDKSKDPSDEFMEEFVEKYKLGMPLDTLIDFDLEAFCRDMYE